MSEPFTSARFSELQRASFSKALRYRSWMLVSQFLIALTTAASVFTNDGKFQLYLAAFGAVMLVLWLNVAHRHRQHKAAGDQARRASMILEALPDSPSASQLFQIFQSFNISGATQTDISNENYYSTDAPKGSGRMAEMLEESAFWTEKLQEASGILMGWLLGASIAVAAIGWLGLALSDDPAQRVALVRVFLAFLAFFLSSDVFGALEGHRAAARTIRDVRLRLTAAQAAGSSQSDILLLLIDYNAAVEAAPMVIPGLYDLRKDRLKGQWKTYREARRATGIQSAGSG